MIDLSQFKLNKQLRFCEKCCPPDSQPKVDICAVCNAIACGCDICHGWINDYVLTFTVLCMCTKGARERILTVERSQNGS